jgi:hypothetical protein
VKTRIKYLTHFFTTYNSVINYGSLHICTVNKILFNMRITEANAALDTKHPQIITTAAALPQDGKDACLS